MYASKPDKFLFIKSNKTAGTSLEIALSRCLSHKAGQFFTPLSFKDEQLRETLSGKTFSEDMISILPIKKSKTRLLRAKITLGLNSLRTPQSKNKRRDAYRNKTERFFLLTGFHTHSTYSECFKNYPKFSDYWSCVFARHPYKLSLIHI